MAIRDFGFEKLPRPAQIALFGALVVGLAVVFYFYCLQDKIQDRDRMQAEIAKLEASVAQSSAIELRLARFKLELAETEQRLKVLQAILPAEKETPSVLRSVQEMAGLSNLKINKFTPQPVVPQSFYSDWPIVIEVEGGYHGLGVFFEKISQATRIIDVDAIAIKGIDKSIDPSRTLIATCTAKTFVFKDDQAAALDENNQNKEKRR